MRAGRRAPVAFVQVVMMTVVTYGMLASGMARLATLLERNRNALGAHHAARRVDERAVLSRRDQPFLMSLPLWQT
jgi:hypothetical protein